jgi:hypothetical protein
LIVAIPTGMRWNISVVLFCIYLWLVLLISLDYRNMLLCPAKGTRFFTFPVIEVNCTCTCEVTSDILCYTETHGMLPDCIKMRNVTLGRPTMQLELEL